MASIFPQWIQDLNIGLSLVSFFISLYVLIEVKRIKKTFLGRARLPDLIRELTKCGSDLSRHLGQWEGRQNEARGQIKIAATLIKAALVMAPKSEKADLKKIQKKISDAVHQSSNQSSLTSEIAWDLYSDVHSCITILNQIKKNMRWG